MHGHNRELCVTAAAGQAAFPSREHSSAVQVASAMSKALLRPPYRRPGQRVRSSIIILRAGGLAVPEVPQKVSRRVGGLGEVAEGHSVTTG